MKIGGLIRKLWVIKYMYEISGIFLPFQNRDPGPMILGKIIRISVYQSNWENGYKTEQGILCIFGVNLRIFLQKIF